MPPLTTMLAAVQLDEGAPAFVERVARWAQWFDVQVDLVTVVDPVMAVDPFTGGAEGAHRAMEHVEHQRQCFDRLHELAQAIPSEHRGKVISRLGPVDKEVIELSSVYGVVAVGTHQRGGLERFLVGSVTEQLLRNSHCPVLVLPPGGAETEFTEVLVPLDPYRFQSASIDWVRQKLPDVSTTAVYALPWLEVFGPVPLAADAIYERAKTALDEALASRGHADVDSFVAVGQESHVGDVLAEQARMSNASLVVLNTHGRTGLERLFLGSVAERTVRASTVPLLILRTTEGA